jgi:hypothetical protein
MSYSNKTDHNQFKYDTATLFVKGGASNAGPGEKINTYLNPSLVNVIAYRVKDMSVYNTFYNVSSDEIFALFGNVTGHQQIVVPAGNYTRTELADYIAAAWLALTGTTIVLDFNSPQFLCTISRTAGVDATISITAAELPPSSFLMNARLGFVQLQAASATLVANQTFILTPVNRIYLNSVVLSGLSRNMELNASPSGLYMAKSNAIFSCQVNLIKGGLNNSIIPSEWMVMSTPQTLNQLDLYISDDRGQLLDLHNYPYTTTIEFRQRKDV